MKVLSHCQLKCDKPVPTWLVENLSFTLIHPNRTYAASNRIIERTTNISPIT